MTSMAHQVSLETHTCLPELEPGLQRPDTQFFVNRYEEKAFDVEN